MLRLINGQRKKKKWRNGENENESEQFEWILKRIFLFSVFAVDLSKLEDETIHYTSQVKWCSTKNHITWNRCSAAIYNVQPPPILHIHLFSFVCALEILTFFGVFLKSMRHLYMFFQLFLHILFFLCWSILNRCCCCVFGACIWMKIIQNAKMRRDKYSRKFEFLIIQYYVYTNVYTTRRHTERKWTHHYRHHMKCTKTAILKQMKNIHIQARVDTFSIWRECGMLCFTRSQRLNQITLRILNK